MLSHVIKTFVEVGHCLIFAFDLCLLEYRECVALEKRLCYHVTCWPLSHVLSLKHCGEPTSELDPLLRSSLVKE
eukprot:6417532-Ditylum_brightwellii.AAC.2